MNFMCRGSASGTRGTCLTSATKLLAEIDANLGQAHKALVTKVQKQKFLDMQRGFLQMVNLARHIDFFSTARHIEKTKVEKISSGVRFRISWFERRITASGGLR